MTTPKKSNSDYWLDGLNDIYDFSTDNQFKLDIALIRLSAARRAVANFVNILTGKSIPVSFNSSGTNATDGKSVSLSAKLSKKSDFDTAVGLALHEGAHILLSDFDLIAIMWSRMPSDLYELGKRKGLNKNTVYELVKYIHNYIEDRYIDNFVYDSAPGYRGYYSALYKSYWDSSDVAKMLKSKLYRVESIESYKARIVNLTNPATDLSALNGLYDIAKTIDISHIERLITPTDRLNTTYAVISIILNSLEDASDDSEVDKSRADDVDDTTDSSKNEKSDTTEAESTDTPKTTRQPFEGKETEKNISDKGDTTGLSSNEVNKIIKSVEKQKNFIAGNIDKVRLGEKTKSLLDIIEKSGVAMCKVGKDLYDVTPTNYDGIDCIVVDNLTKELIESPQFPLKAFYTDYFNEYKKQMDDELLPAIRNGIRMGTILAKKLQIINETNTISCPRRHYGKIDRRLLADLGWESDNIFTTKQLESNKNVFLHISVDASSSMSIPYIKWTNTLSVIIAICKAAALLNTIHVTVSFRTSVSENQTFASIPYVVIAYDSEKDKFSKILNLFPLLHPDGSTPEGLAYESIINHFNQAKSYENRYFLNISDGEPFMRFSNGNTTELYADELAAIHTRKQINKIKAVGYQVLSYFISNTDEEPNDNLIKLFKKMYGPDAKFIQILNVSSIIKTLNQLFQKK